MNAIAILEHEHEAILFGIGLMEKALGRALAHDAVARKDLDELLRFVRGFADACHHGKEEGILFPAMEKAGIAKAGGPIGVMLDEHVRGRDFVRAMDEGLKAEDLAGRFAAALSGYAALLRAHIEKENTVLFPMGARVLGEGVLESMGREFDTYEENVMGSGEHERLHAMLDELSARYR